MAVVATWGNADNSGLDYASAKLDINSTAVNVTAVGAFYENSLSGNGKRDGIDATLDGKGFSSGTVNPSGLWSKIRFQNFSYLAVYGGISPGSKNFFISVNYSFRWLNGFTDSVFNVATCEGTGDAYKRRNTYYYEGGLIKNSARNNNINAEQHIIVGYDVELPKPPNAWIDRCLWIGCKFKMYNGGLGNDESVFTESLTIEELRLRAVTVFGGVVSDYFPGETDVLQDVLTVLENPEKGCFYLKNYPENPALNFTGLDKIGALPPCDSFMDIATYTDLVNIDSNGNITASTDWSATSPIHDSGSITQLKWIDASYLMDVVNGEQINSEDNIGVEISAGTEVLTVGKTYTVYGSITHSAIAFTDSMCFVAQNQDFTTASGGYVKEVIGVDANDIRTVRSKVQLKISLWDATLNSANPVLFFIEPHTDGYCMCNVDVNGNITHGNADADFDVATAVVVKYRYIQVYAKGKGNNLRAQL